MPAPANASQGTAGESLNRIAFVATLHCLLGCAIGEVSGLVIGNALGWSNGQTIVLAVVLAFISGFALTAIPFLRRGYSLPAALRVALAAAMRPRSRSWRSSTTQAPTVSITVASRLGVA